MTSLLLLLGCDVDTTVLAPTAAVTLEVDNTLAISTSAMVNHLTGPPADGLDCLDSTQLLFSQTVNGLGGILWAATEPGTATESISPDAKFQWSSTDTEAQANRDFDRSWAGRLTIETWTDDLVEVTLSDGEVCDTLSGGCAPADGSLRVSGERISGPMEEGSRTEQTDWGDVGTGEPLCGFTTPTTGTDGG